MQILFEKARMILTITLDGKSKIEQFQQALTMSYNKVLVKASDGDILTSGLIIASEMVREMILTRGCCQGEPVILIPNTDKRTVALLDRILVNGFAEITPENGNIERIVDTLLKLSRDLGFEPSNLEVEPFTKKDPEKDIVKDEPVDVSDDEDNFETPNQDKNVEDDTSDGEVSLFDSSLDRVEAERNISNDPVDRQPIIVQVEGAPSISWDKTGDEDFIGEHVLDELFNISQGQSGEENPSSFVDVSYTCSQCDKKFNREAKLKNHVEANHGARESE